MATVFCGTCGREIGADARFCPSCGTANVVAAAETPAEPVQAASSIEPPVEPPAEQPTEPASPEASTDEQPPPSPPGAAARAPATPLAELLHLNVQVAGLPAELWLVIALFAA